MIHLEVNHSWDLHPEQIHKTVPICKVGLFPSFRLIFHGKAMLAQLRGEFYKVSFHFKLDKSLNMSHREREQLLSGNFFHALHGRMWGKLGAPLSFWLDRRVSCSNSLFGFVRNTFQGLVLPHLSCFEVASFACAELYSSTGCFVPIRGKWAMGRWGWKTNCSLMILLFIRYISPYLSRISFHNSAFIIQHWPFYSAAWLVISIDF